MARLFERVTKDYWIFRDFPPRRRDDGFVYIRGNRSSVLDGIFARKNLFPRTINAKLVTLWVVRGDAKLRLELFFLSRCTRLWKVLLKWKDRYSSLFLVQNYLLLLFDKCRVYIRRVYLRYARIFIRELGVIGRDRCFCFEGERDVASSV